MNYCKDCGAEMLDGARYCSKCGAPVEQKSRSNYWLVVVGIILLLSGIITMASADADFTSVGVVFGYAFATTIKVAIPVGVIALIVWLIKKNKK